MAVPRPVAPGTRRRPTRALVDTPVRPTRVRTRQWVERQVRVGHRVIPVPRPRRPPQPRVTPGQAAPGSRWAQVDLATAAGLARGPCPATPATVASPATCTRTPIPVH